MRRTKRLSLEQLAPSLWQPPEPPGAPPGAFDPKAVFGNDRPLEVEVGCGKGLFLLTESLARPGVNFLGIEIVRKYQLFTATRIAIRNLTNVRVACADGRLFLRDRLAAGSVSAVHVYFPDPWWKTRHHKRRLFTAEFARAVARVLMPSGRLHVATDVEAYFGVMTGLVAEMPQLRPLPAPTERDDTTNFERKARSLGKPVFRAVYERTPDDPAGRPPRVGDMI
jgi:tRNA (guanine-N7-)-methyltransferase